MPIPVLLDLLLCPPVDRIIAINRVRFVPFYMIDLIFWVALHGGPYCSTSKGTIIQLCEVSGITQFNSEFPC